MNIRRPEPAASSRVRRLRDCDSCLGIGASTAMFSVAYGVSLRPLPVADPNRLIRVYEANLAEGQLEHDVSIRPSTNGGTVRRRWSRLRSSAKAAPGF